MAGVARGDVDISSGTAFMQRYAASLQPGAACSFTLGLLSFQTGSRITCLTRPAVLQCTVAAAQAISPAACAQAPSQWHENVLAELKHILHAAAQDSSSHSQLTTQAGKHTSRCIGVTLPQLPFAALVVITLSSHIPVGWHHKLQQHLAILDCRR